MTPFRIGIGYDVHQLREGYALWLGGIRIAHRTGAVGHSDADVLIHAICDALLGALTLGDIGIHFPDTDAKFKGIDSKILLEKVVELIHQRGYKVGNVDTVLTLQAPKIKNHIPAMTAVLTKILQIDSDALSIKATTAEKMGFVGQFEGVEARAVALLYKI
jgi:2-C-methyl-D-erythritol 2,4-cyclodiphosphate synthase